KLALRMIGRGEVIRTLDPLHPMQVRYQAALRPDVNLKLYLPQRGGRSSRRISSSFCLISASDIADAGSGREVEGDSTAALPGLSDGAASPLAIAVRPASVSSRCRAPLIVKPCSYSRSRMRRINSTS